MLKVMRFLPVAICAATLMTSTACAAGVYYPARGPVVDRDDRAFYDRGFREGRASGIEDARRGRSYDLRRHNEYRDDRRGDDRGDLLAFRRGFEAGYNEGFRVNGRDGDRRGFPPEFSPNQPPPRVEQRERTSPARDIGYRDGFEAGEHAARSRDRSDPVRERRYREGNHEYDRRFGSLDDYKREYRDAFKAGYDAGYRGRR